MQHGKLYLIPTLLGDSPAEDVIPGALGNRIGHIRHFVVEDLRTARRFIRKINPSAVIDDMVFEVLDKHTEITDIPGFINPLLEGHDLGLMSEAGTPCVADPGATVVSLAHHKGIRVIPLTGPSSITLALMASGFNGQHFTFHGYLPIDRNKRAAAIKKLEQDARNKDQTQIFIETPYRNMQMFDTISSVCKPDTRLCIAANLTTDDEMVATRSIAAWNKDKPAINKQPAVFLIYKP